MSLLNGIVNGEEFIDGKKHGVHKIYTHEFNKYGQVVEFWRMGIPWRENYINGKRDGLCVYFYENGIKAEKYIIKMVDEPALLKFGIVMVN